MLFLGKSACFKFTVDYYTMLCVYVCWQESKFGANAIQHFFPEKFSNWFACVCIELWWIIYINTMADSGSGFDLIWCDVISDLNYKHLHANFWMIPIDRWFVGRLNFEHYTNDIYVSESLALQIVVITVIASIQRNAMLNSPIEIPIIFICRISSAHWTRRDRHRMHAMQSDCSLTNW